MSLFENISFINEGEQAEEYKERKAREEYEKKVRSDAHVSHREPTIYLDDKDKDKKIDHMKQVSKFIDRDESRRVKELTDGLEVAAKRKLSDDEKTQVLNKASNVRNAGYTTKDLEKWRIHSDDHRNYRSSAHDAIRRDMRRHPDRWKKDSEGNLHRESGIFEFVQFINE